ncbi:L,D-peptidoglycan transpeptidase YkuD, ErfK/YbiS/YcfS/YnhG family [Dyella jiangningensis]|nr:L,D-peptidoglycan transpeptidase YkuD (ErfK/YbiS/YcfS/YnhG family) [Dyella sp. AtDHG13]SDJ31437.1 L,D-peptidoglycan transpeptidase YkuD, ErfK/YbiS/YcfS/YnhG family [Dyella jiangningensis]
MTMSSHRITIRRFLAAALAVAAIGPVVASAGDADWKASRQMVLVITPDWNADHGVLRAFERSGDGWKPVVSAQAVTVGKSGAAWGLGLSEPQADGPQKREGDGRAAAGVYRIGEAFGYAANAGTRMPYHAMTDTDWCVDVDGSPYYNQIVDSRKVGEKAVEGASEPMRRDLHLDGDQRYKIGFVIEHNAKGQRGGGSCIFAHLWASPTDATAGCTAMPEPVMRRLLAWMKPEEQPVFVLLPQSEYARLRTSWHLPAVEAQP